MTDFALARVDLPDILGEPAGVGEEVYRYLAC